MLKDTASIILISTVLMISGVGILIAICLFVLCFIQLVQEYKIKKLTKKYPELKSRLEAYQQTKQRYESYERLFIKPLRDREEELQKKLSKAFYRDQKAYKKQIYFVKEQIQEKIRWNQQYNSTAMLQQSIQNYIRANLNPKDQKLIEKLIRNR